LLVNYFPDLLKETFSHSNPRNDDVSKPLIRADRLELRRFSNYQTWTDQRFDAIYQQLPPDKVTQLNLFYQTIRPALEYFYTNRQKIFIRHGLERQGKEYWQEAIYPPAGSYLEQAVGYPIETDRLPFGQPNNFKASHQNTHCSNHGKTAFWNQIKGFITLNDFVEKGGVIINSKKRDHLYAKSSISLSNWVFIYQNAERRGQEINELLEQKNSLVSQETLLLFYNLVKVVADRITVLNTRMA